MNKMGVTIYWGPAEKQEKHFEGATTTTLSAMKETFGDKVTVHDVATLRAMTRVSGNRFYDDVADKVEQVGSIMFWEGC
jgi:hypothetical protein